MDTEEGTQDPPLERQPLHAVDRRLDVAFAALTDTPPHAFLHCLGHDGPAPPTLRERMPDARWIPADAHALAFVDPSDHLTVHRAWLEACHGPDRVGRATVRTIQPLASDDPEAPGPIGRYGVTLIDLTGTPGMDAVVVVLTPIGADDQQAVQVAPPPRGAASFRLRVDLDGRVIAGTTTVSSLLGRPLADLLGQPVVEIIHPDDLEAASGTWDDVIAKPDQSQTVRLRLLHADGTWRWFSDTAWNALDDPDEPGILSEFHDISALVDAEEALHASELGFRTLAESLPVGVAVLDQDGRVQFANHRLITILEDAGLWGSDVTSPLAPLSGGEFSASWVDLVSPDVAEQVEDLLAPGDPSSSTPTSRQIDVDRPDRPIIHLLVQAVTIWNHEGRQVIVSLQDVTREVQTGQEHSRLLHVVDEVGDLVIVGRLGHGIAYLNQAARRFLGDQAVGQPLLSYLGDDLRRLSDADVRATLADRGTWNGDVDVRDAEGELHTMATTISPVQEAGGSDLYLGITMRDVTAKRAHERELSRLARQDALTGLPNRFALMELLDDTRTQGPPDDEIAVFFIDLDNLKIVNDGLGHSAGDRLLVAVADELQRSARADTVARFGGDEFVVVCEGLTPATAVERAERFLAAVERAEVIGVSSHVSASIGVATAPRHLVDAESLIRDADAAMYAAKRAGRSRCALFDEELRARVRQRFQLEADLRTAIEADALTVHFQPIVSLDSGAVTGVEALCRWDRTTPDQFIPVAEESGLILPLGAQVVAKALRDGARLRAAGAHLADLRIGVNVSARELDQANFAAQTIAVIAASGIPPEHVVLELTESVLIDPREEVDACLRELRSAGVEIALDDFGSGYSSLTYLRRYPIDVLKLDITYTQSMVDDADTRVIVEMLTTMARRLGIRLVAEGVETPEQLQLVQELGIDWAQGYLVGRPATADALLEQGLDRRSEVTPRG